MNETQSPCACQKFDRFEGAAMQGYIAQFLQAIGADGSSIFYECRACQTKWQKIKESKRPSLVRTGETMSNELKV
jgi:hypothetical protein